MKASVIFNVKFCFHPCLARGRRGVLILGLIQFMQSILMLTPSRPSFPNLNFLPFYPPPSSSFFIVNDCCLSIYPPFFPLSYFFYSLPSFYFRLPPFMHFLLLPSFSFSLLPFLLWTPAAILFTLLSYFF